MNNLIFIGTIKKVANCGESMKNHFFIDRFNEVYDKVIAFDTWGVKHQPWRLLYLLYILFRYPKTKIVVSASTYIAYDVIKFLNFFGKKNIYYWVIGGVFPQLAKKNNYKLDYYRKLKGIFVESPRMVETLKNMDINNAKYVPNFKRINYRPSIEKKKSEIIKFVFLSRIHPDKGCPLIINSVKQLNKKGYKYGFVVDFYGPIDPEYNEFLDSIKGVDNINYRGFLKLDKKGYDRLAEYDMMLFPTFWNGEGFPGIVVDAFTAGLPILASDWNFNTELVDENTGIIIPHSNQEALTNAMLNILQGNVDLAGLSKNCYNKAMDFDDRNVLSEGKLKALGVL